MPFIRRLFAHSVLILVLSYTKHLKYFMPPLRRKGVVFYPFYPLKSLEIFGTCVFFLSATLGLFPLILCWVLHIDIECEIAECFYNIRLKAFKCPGGILHRDIAQAVNPPILFRKGYNTTKQSDNPAINTVYIDMLWCWYMNYSMITFVTAACLFSSWRGRIELSDQSCCLYLEQCSVEHLIRRSPNNSNGDGIVCDWCGFVPLYVWGRESMRGRVSIYLCQLRADAVWKQ